MATQHEYIDNLLTGRSTTPPTSRAEQLKLESEVRAVQKIMLVLPTAREADALPELQHLLAVSRYLLEEEPTVNALIAADETLRAIIVGELFEHVCRSIIKVRIYNNKEIVRVADQLFCNLVTWATRLIRHDFKEILELLNAIIDKSADYYKNNGKESSFSFPFGEQLHIDDAHRAWIDGLAPGDSVDALKNYGGKRQWSRAVIISNEHSLLKLRFSCDTYETYVQNRYFELARPGTRASDFEWRQALQPGDQVDYYNNRQDWVRHTVVVVSVERNAAEESVHSLKLAPTGSNTGAHDNLASIRAQSPALAQPGRYSDRGGGIDDSEDEIFLAMAETPKFAIMRATSVYNSSSIFLIKYINLFGAAGGFDHLLTILAGETPASQDVLGLHVRLMQASADYLVEPFMRSHGKRILKSIKAYVLRSAERSLRDLSQANLNAILEGVACLAQRVYPVEKARRVSDELRLSIALLCLNSEFLEKQFFGAKVVAGIEARLRTRESDLSRAELAKRLADAGIFERVVKGHSSLVAKSSGILSILFTENAINEAQLDFLWTEIGKTDVDSRNALLTVLKDSLWNFSREEVRYFVGAIQKRCEALTDVELFELLFALKRVAWNRHNDADVVGVVNEVLWQVLQSQKNLKEELRKDIIKNFIKFLQEEASGEGDYPTRMLDAVLARDNVDVNLKILGKLLKLDNALSYSVLDAVESRQLLPALLGEVTQQLSAPTSTPRAFDRELKFIDLATRLAGDERPLIAFADVERLFALLFSRCLDVEPVMRWIKRYVMREHEIAMLPSLTAFFDAHVDGLLKPGATPFLPFFVILFFKINILQGRILRQRVQSQPLAGGVAGLGAKQSKVKLSYALAVPVAELACFGALWSVFERTDDETLESRVGDFVVKVHLRPEAASADEELYAREAEALYTRCVGMYATGEGVALRKAAVLLEQLMKREERFGFGPLRSLAALREGERLVLEIEKNIKYFKDRFKTTLSTSSTLTEVRERIVREYRIAFPAIELHVGTPEGLELTPFDNSKTLEELKLRMRDLLIVDEKEVLEAQEAQLLDESGKKFTPRALAVFREIFTRFSTDDRMSRQNLADFTTAATENMSCTADDPRIKHLFDRYDPNGTGTLDFDAFIEFYTESAAASEFKALTVRENLLSLGYGRDLRLRAETSAALWTSSSRYRLATDSTLR